MSVRGRNGGRYVRAGEEDGEGELLSAATAYAQSIYLLWSHFTLRDGEHWQVHYAFESKKECTSAAAAALREAARLGNTVAGDRVTTASGDLAPVCLPDTVDPRGAKGK